MKEQGEEDNLYYNGDDKDNESVPSGNEQAPEPRKASAWKSWLRVLTTPLKGWKMIKASRMKSSEMETSVFYPLVALASLGAFASKFYFPDAVSVSDCLIEATCIFVAFFSSYFLAFPLAKLLMRKDCAKRIDTQYGHCYVASLMSTLAVFFFLYECLPFLEVLIAFTPAYTIYLSFKGMEPFRVPENRRISTWVALIMMIIALPIIAYQLLGMLLPANIVAEG